MEVKSGTRWALRYAVRRGSCAQTLFAGHGATYDVGVQNVAVT